MLIDVLILTSIAGFSAILGAALGSAEGILGKWLKMEIRHGIIAFGGGALLAAVSLVLIPKGMALQPGWMAVGSFAVGAAWFMLVDQYFARRGSPVSQFMAMMLDFVPEAVVVGALITNHYAEAVFMTVIIAAQNFPEAFTAYREMHESKDNGVLKHHSMAVIAFGSLSGLLWGLIGLKLFEADSVLLGTMMTFCAGGIFYLVFRDVAPQARLENHWYPSFGAVIGFLVGMTGHEIVAAVTQ